jgi:cytochrome c oxidase subunit II
MQRRTLALAAALLLAGAVMRAPAQAAPRRIAISARKFEFSMSEIRATRGESIVLVLSAADFVHGFSIPELNARVDIVPGKTVELALRDLRPGRYAVLCDNFCGDGHDKMTTALLVA